jgi:hypothetical protein
MKEIGFIDLAIRDIETRIEGLRSGVAAVTRDALAPVTAQIVRALDSHSGLDAIHSSAAAVRANCALPPGRFRSASWTSTGRASP